MNTYDFLKVVPKSDIIHKTILTLNQKLNTYKNVLVSISGGSDSDIMLDLIEHTDHNAAINYAFYDTGIEYDATKRHLDDVESKYGISIARYRAQTPVPLGVKKFGVPFFSKKYAEYISRLQRHGFKWETDEFDKLYQIYPKCKAALRWWCSEFGDGSSFNINKSLLLKEYMSENPPSFLISPMCCNGAKKNTAKFLEKEIHPDMRVVGTRRAEGGARATSYTSCFSPKSHNRDIAEYRPLFFWTDEDKFAYKQAMGIKYSDCYEVYGLKRTGCAGCPFSSRFEEELDIINQYEPKLYNAVTNIFGNAYEYARKYRRYKKGDKD